MENVSIDDVENQPNPLQVHEVRRPVSQALGTEEFAMNYFELGPGDSFSGGLHRHLDQEEVFYIEEGAAVFEVGREREEYTVEAGELIRFEPGEFQKGTAVEDGDGVVGWALGAPGASHEWDQLESLVYCSECEQERAHTTTLTDEGRFELSCNECGAEMTL